jgi:superfamily II DNA or RNA helicase
MSTLRDQLAKLTYPDACKLLGVEGAALLQTGGQYTLSVDEHVRFSGHALAANVDDAVVWISAPAAGEMQLSCSQCSAACEHVGAALSLVLEEKLALGLAEPAPQPAPVESLSDEELVARALQEREERARTERMVLRSADPEELWTDYAVTNRASGKTYRVALRGRQRGESFCTCPDFRKNTLGTCKHIVYALGRARTRFKKAVRDTPYRPDGIYVHLKYGTGVEVRLIVPEDLADEASEILGPLRGGPVDDLPDLLRRIRRVEALGHPVTVYPDAEAYIDAALTRARLRARAEELRRAPAQHPLRTELLRVPLLPHQLDGIAFAAGAGRAILADDMGLGKTIQGIGVAELLAREAGVAKVLVVCPASLKAQWRSEVQRFSDRDCQLVVGPSDRRAEQYDNDCFFTVCNYEQVLRDIDAIERVRWDLIVLDEGQRIKNWETKTSRIVKSLRSPFALVLTGTPLENRLDDLYSIVEFIDDRRLGPAFRFFSRHRIQDERGKVLGYKNLDQVRDQLRPVLLRRTRREVLDDLPPRTTEILRIPPTEEQLALHDSQKRVISSIVRKKYISEMDLLRLQKALLLSRMAANSTFLVDKREPGCSSKLEEIEQLLEQLLAEEDRKIVLFSEWTTMLDLIEALLEPRGVSYVRLDGSVPQQRRQGLVQRFQTAPECKLFLTSNAGSTGLNLQAANTVINVDLPWNPAVLEQRIARAHRMGQERPVHVYLLVTENTIEEGLLGTLAAKHELALAALDPESEVSAVDLVSGIEELKRRLEVLIGAKPEAPVDASMRAKVEEELSETLRRKRKVAAAGGRLLSAAFELLGEMVPEQADTPQVEHMAETFRSQLAQCLEPDEEGNPTLRLSLPDPSALDALARTLARLAASG